MEEIIQLLIYLHAALGGVALFAGLVSLIAKKGMLVHKRAGITFFYSMMLSGLIAMLVATLPGHRNAFLFAIGIFSLYFVLTGYRAINFKKKDVNLKADHWISWIMILTSVLMIFLPILVSQSINIILVVFALVGLWFAIRDLMLYRKPSELKSKWLAQHLSKMLGGYISATTAFVVVNNFFGGIYGWFVPGLVGTGVIIYWLRKVSPK